MGHSQADKAQSRARILSAAAAQIREAGLESISVARLMESVNLTHGGFYGHFGSRSDLLAEALQEALIEGEVAARASTDAGKPRTLSRMVRSYLSRAHRDAPEKGCAMAALISDAGRADDAIKAVMTPHLDRFIASLTDALGAPDERKAIVAVSAMIGALAISRVMTDARRSDAVLRTVSDFVIAMKQDAAR